MDWSKLEWNADLLKGIESITITPEINPDVICARIVWKNKAGEIVRQDTHIQVINPIITTGEAGL